jgi:hypothetical protein
MCFIVLFRRKSKKEMAEPRLPIQRFERCRHAVTWELSADQPIDISRLCFRFQKKKAQLNEILFIGLDTINLHASAVPIDKRYSV